MAKFPFVQVDAFTDRPLGGNPCAVVFDADPLDDATMQAVAQEMNLSETAFVLRSQVADVGARYFTPTACSPKTCSGRSIAISCFTRAARPRRDGR